MLHVNLNIPSYFAFFFTQSYRTSMYAYIVVCTQTGIHTHTHTSWCHQHAADPVYMHMLCVHIQLYIRVTNTHAEYTLGLRFTYFGSGIFTAYWRINTILFDYQGFFQGGGGGVAFAWLAHSCPPLELTLSSAVHVKRAMPPPPTKLRIAVSPPLGPNPVRNPDYKTS